MEIVGGRNFTDFHFADKRFLSSIPDLQESEEILPKTFNIARYY